MLHGDILGERARLTPDKVALVDVATGLRLSYRDLDARVSSAAWALTDALGLDKGQRLALLVGNSIEFVELFLAAGRTGIVAVPLNTRLSPAEIDQIVQDASPSACVADDDLADRFTAGHVTTTARYAGFRDRYAGHPFPRVPCDGEDLYCLLYTSGTTGRPKGVRLPHRMIAWNAYNTVIGWQLQDDDVAPVYTPLYHAGGVSVFMLPLFAIGGTVVLHGSFDAEAIWRTIEAERCSVVFGVPTTFRLLMDAPGFATADLRHVRWFISGGAPLPEYIVDAYQRRGVTFKQGYGLTEVGVNCFAMTMEDSIHKKGTIGKPLMFTEAKLIDAQGVDVPQDVVGELLLRGPHVCQGYWNNPRATEEALDADGWFHTGDLARRDADGYFSIAGRKKDMFISGGVNIYPAEIEAALLLHPSVQDAAVVGVPHDRWGETGAAFIVARPGTTPTVDELVRHLEQRIARYKVPREFRFVHALPRTEYGKVVKAELRGQL